MTDRLLITEITRILTMKLYVVYDDGGYCDPGTVWGVFSALELAQAAKKEHLGSQIVERELDIIHQPVEIDCTPKPGENPWADALINARTRMLKILAESNPYIELLESSHNQDSIPAHTQIPPDHSGSS